MPEHLCQGSECPPQDSNKIRLYGMYYCPFTLRVRLVLEYHNIDYETVWVNLKDKPDWFTSRIPGGKVPAIEQEGQKMMDSEMICCFLDQLHPENSLVDASGPENIEKAKQWWGKIFKAFHAIQFEAEVTEDQKKTFTACLKEFEELVGSPYISGEKPGLADLLVYPIFERLEACLRLAQLPPFTAEEFPRLSAWLEAMRSQEAVKKIHVDEEQHFQVGLTHKRGGDVYNM